MTGSSPTPGGSVDPLGARSIARGRWAAQVPVAPGQDAEVVAARLWAAGAEGIWERRGRLVGYFSRPPGEIEPGRLDLLPTATTWTHEPEVDHVAAWRAAARPVRAGAVEVVPHHLAASHETPADRHRILLDPGQAFGSGHHATTAGCLDLLAEFDPAGRRVLDLGTGTGILAIAAIKQGAVEVLAIDTDPHAITVATDNATANGVAPRFAIGSLADVDDTFDIVLANLLTTTLVALARDLPRVLVPGGRLVASGVGSERAHVVAHAFTKAGLGDVAIRPRGDWVVITARAPGPG